MKKSETLNLFKIASNKKDAAPIQKNAYKLKSIVDALLTSKVDIYELSAISDGWIPPIGWETNPARSKNKKILSNASKIRNSYNEKIIETEILKFINKLKQSGNLKSTFNYDVFKSIKTA